MSLPVFANKGCFEHVRVVRRKHHRNPVAKQSGKRVLREGGSRISQLKRECPGTQVAHGAHLQRNTTVGEKIHERVVMDRGDAMAHARNPGQLDSLAYVFRPANFTSMNQAMQSAISRQVVNGPEFPGGDAEFIAADPEGHDARRAAALGPTNNLEGMLRPELPDRIEHPIQPEPLCLKRLDGRENSFKIRLWILLTKQHKADGKRYLRINDILFKEPLGKVRCEQGKIDWVAKERSYPFKSLDKAGKV